MVEKERTIAFERRNGVLASVDVVLLEPRGASPLLWCVSIRVQHETLDGRDILGGGPGWQDLLSRWGDEAFECGEDRDERAVLLDLEDFLRYTAEQEDDSPLYLFDGTFDVGAKDLLDLYSPPHVFRWDLLSQWGDEGERPPFRWFLLGPTRSGSNPHVDPLETSAWNALLAGRKLWVFFPPETDPTELFLEVDAEVKLEASAWFMEHLPGILSLARGGASGLQWCFQEPGDVMAVPSGWWHAVLNVSESLTVAVTQNFACPLYIHRTVDAVRMAPPGVGWETWLARMQQP